VDSTIESDFLDHRYRLIIGRTLTRVAVPLSSFSPRPARPVQVSLPFPYVLSPFHVSMIQARARPISSFNPGDSRYV
jgi:hypothetical protein